MKGRNVQVELVDLREYNLPACDGDSCYKDDNVLKLTKEIREAKGVVIATPVYNYAASSSAKNMIEVVDSAWEGKVVGFVCAAGGKASYMAVMGLANSLMLDFRTFIIPRFVYASTDAFGDGTIVDEKVKERLNLLGEDMVKITTAIAGNTG